VAHRETFRSNNCILPPDRVVQPDNAKYATRIPKLTIGISSSINIKFLSNFVRG
jgi:hypothetical protein